MTTRTILYSVPPGVTQRVVRSVQFVSPTAFARDRGNYYKVVIGIAKAGKVDVLGTYSGADKDLAANVPFEITGGQINEGIDESQLLVADVTTVGSPTAVPGGGCMVDIHHSIARPAVRHSDRAIDLVVSDLEDYILDIGDGAQQFFRGVSLA